MNGTRSRDQLVLQILMLPARAHNLSSQQTDLKNLEEKKLLSDSLSFRKPQCRWQTVQSVGSEIFNSHDQQLLQKEK